MRKPATGEPYAGEPLVRFGGRGGQRPSLPLSAENVATVFFKTDLIIPATRCARVLRDASPSISKRAQGRPGAGRTHGPPANKKAGGSHHRFGRTSGLPCAVVFRLIRALPGNRACLLPSYASLVTLRTWPQRREARTTRLRRPHRCRSSSAPTRPPHPASRFVTIAHTPLMPRRDGGRMHLIWGQSQVDC